MNIYEYFNSRDIAEHCKSIGYTFTSIEIAYLVWHSNHHTLEDKHRAWQEIIETMPDEPFRPNWDFGEHTLHSFLRTYMRLQNDFIRAFSAENYVYTYATLYRHDDRYAEGNIFYSSYDTCLSDLKRNELDEDEQDEIVKAMVTRHRLYDTHTSFREAQDEEAIIFDKQLRPIDIAAACVSQGEERFLSPSYGFYEMWVAIPTPFQKGDIVADVDTGKPFILDRLPYWKKDDCNGEGCHEEIERLLALGADWTDMSVGAFLQDYDGEIYWDHGFDYLNLELYRGELHGTEQLLCAVSSAMQGKITAEELLRVHSIVLMENYASEMRKYFGCNQELLRLCGSSNEQ